MKKTVLLLLVFMSLAFSVNAYAANGILQNIRSTDSSAAGSLKTQVQTTQMDNLRQRAQTEINRRLGFLNSLLTKIADIKKLSSSDKTDLQAQIQDQITSLTNLQTKINADTDLITLRADVKSIVNGYFIFAFFRVKVSLLYAADRMSNVSNNLTLLHEKLQTRINDLTSQGQNETTLNSDLSDMASKIDAANTQLQNVETQLATLTAQGFPGNKQNLYNARTELKTAFSDLMSAYQDAVRIKASLEANNSTPAAHISPSQVSTSSGK